MKTETLDTLVFVDIGKTPSRHNPKYWDKDKRSSNVWVSIKDMSNNKSLYIDDSSEYISDEGAKLFKEVPKETLIMSFKLSIGKLAITKKNLRTNEAIASFIIKDKNIIDTKYLYYYLLGINWDQITGSDIKIKGKTLNKKKIKKINISYPPINKQKEIVKKLDKIFDEINKNLNTTQESFHNYDDLLKVSVDTLIVSKSKKIKKLTLGNFFKLSSGKFLPSKAMKLNGSIKVYGGNGVCGKHNKFNLTGENILIGRVGAKCGNIHRVKENIWLTDNCMYAHTFKHKINLKFLSILLKAYKLGSYAKQTAQPVISFSRLKNIEIKFPESEELQKKITSDLEFIENKVSDLKDKYLKKIKLYDDLKASFLNKFIFEQIL